MAKNYQGKLIFSERREVKYPADPFSFLKGNLLTISLSPLSLLPPTSSSSAMSKGEFSAYQVGLILGIKVSGLANLLKP